MPEFYLNCGLHEISKTRLQAENNKKFNSPAPIKVKLFGNMENLIIRQAEKKDIQVLAEIRVRFLHELDYELDDETCRAQTILFLDNALGQQIFGAVAEIDGQILSAGLLLVQKRLYHPLAQIGCSGELLNVFTEPEWRGQGLGSQILDALISQGRELGLDKLFLNASEDGYLLYQSREFVESKPKHPVMELKL